MSDLLAQSQAAASSAEARKTTGEIVEGPFPVGNIGHVQVVAREFGESRYLYAEFTGTGRPSRIPLAAAAAIVDALSPGEGEEE